MLPNIRNYVVETFYNGVGIGENLYEQGWQNGLYRSASSLKGIERTTKLLNTVTTIAIAYFDCGKIFKKLNQAAEEAKDFYYAVAVFDTAKSVFNIRDEYRRDGAIGVIVVILNAGAAFFEDGKFLKKYAHITFPVFTDIANQLGSFEIGGFQLFSYKPFSALVSSSPKGFFVFTSSSIQVAQALYRMGQEIRNDVNGGVRRHIANSSENLLKITVALGRVYMVWNSSSNPDIKFRAVELITNISNLFAHIIRDPN